MLTELEIRQLAHTLRVDQHRRHEAHTPRTVGPIRADNTPIGAEADFTPRGDLESVGDLDLDLEPLHVKREAATERESVCVCVCVCE